MVPQLGYARADLESFPSQYPAVVDIPDQGFRGEYSNGVGEIPRARGLHSNPTNTNNSVLIAEKLRNDVLARRMLACSAQVIPLDTPIDDTPYA